MNSHVRQTNRDAITIPLQTAASLYDGREILQKSGRNMGDIRRFCLIFYGRATARRRRHRHPATTDFSQSQKPEDTPPSMTPRTTSRAGTPRHQRNHHNLPEIPAQPTTPGSPTTQEPRDAPSSPTTRHTTNAGTRRYQRNRRYLPEIPAQIAIPGQLATQQPEDAPLSAPLKRHTPRAWYVGWRARPRRSADQRHRRARRAYTGSCTARWCGLGRASESNTAHPSPP